MVFVNNAFDVTMAPRQMTAASLLQASGASVGLLNFQQAREKNRIYAGNGHVCYDKMCQSMTGCKTKLGCPAHPEWKQVQEFCGSEGPGGIYEDGAYWVRLPADGQQQLLQSTEAATGMSVLPNPYNVVGMY